MATNQGSYKKPREFCLGGKTDDFPSNYIKTTKFTALNFVPLGLYN